MKKSKVIIGAVALVSGLVLAGCQNAVTPDVNLTDQIAYENTVSGDPVVVEEVKTELDNKGVYYSGDLAIEDLIMHQPSEAAYKAMLANYPVGNKYEYDSLTTLKSVDGSATVPLAYPAEGTRFVDFTRNQIKVTTFTNGKFVDKTYNYEVRFEKTAQNNLKDLKKNAVLFITAGNKLLTTIKPAEFVATEYCLMPNAELRGIWENAYKAYSVRENFVKAELAKYNTLKDAYDVWYNFVKIQKNGYDFGGEIRYESKNKVSFKNPADLKQSQNVTLYFEVESNSDLHCRIGSDLIYIGYLPSFNKMESYTEADLVKYEKEILKKIDDNTLNNGKNWYYTLDGNVLKMYISEKTLWNATNPDNGVYQGYNDYEGFYIKLDASNWFVQSDVEGEPLYKSINLAVGVRDKKNHNDIDLCNTVTLERTKRTVLEFNDILSKATKDAPWTIGAAASEATNTVTRFKRGEDGRAVKKNADGEYEDSNCETEDKIENKLRLPETIVYFNKKSEPWHGTDYDNKFIIEAKNKNDKIKIESETVDPNGWIIPTNNFLIDLIGSSVPGYNPYLESVSFTCPGTVLEALNGCTYKVTIDAAEKNVTLDIVVPESIDEVDISDYKTNHIEQVKITR